MNTNIEDGLKKRPLVSIIMPCYNSEEYIDRSIQSCLNQTFDNWELIIVNDGSTDNTLNIVNSYASHDKRLRVYSKENGGYISAVNYGLDYVNGIYFMFMGSDDEITPVLFEKIYEHLENERLPDMVGFRTSVLKADKTVIDDESSCFYDVVQAYDCNIKDFSSGYPKESSILFIRDTSKMYKTDLLGSLRYFGKKGMDADGIFSMLFAHKSTSFLCVPVIGYLWYLRNESLSGRKMDYQTQIDRLNNWFEFGNEINKMDMSMVTNQEKFYLTDYFFSIVKSVVIFFYFNCLKDKIVEKSKAFLANNVIVFGDEWADDEIKFFLNHTFLWKYTVLPRDFLYRIKKHIKKSIRKIIAK